VCEWHHTQDAIKRVETEKANRQKVKNTMNLRTSLNPVLFQMAVVCLSTAAASGSSFTATAILTQNWILI